MLHIGNGHMVFSDHVLAILDMTHPLSSSARTWLMACMAQGIVTRLEGKPRSLVVVSRKEGSQVYLSPISASALAGRTRKAHGRALTPYWSK